jgi:hypothetical protein
VLIDERNFYGSAYTAAVVTEAAMLAAPMTAVFLAKLNGT